MTEGSNLIPSDQGRDELFMELVLPVFFYLNTGQSILGLPIEDLDHGIIVAFPYKWEVIKDKEGNYSRVKPFYPIPVITVHYSGICYEAPPPISAEIKYLSTILSEKRRELQLMLHKYGFDPEASIEAYKRRRMILENPTVI